MEKIRYLRNKEKRHAEKMERVQNEEFHKQILGTLEEDFNHNFVDPLKDWTGGILYCAVSWIGPIFTIFPI
jgi:hypothetical protein